MSRVLGIVGLLGVLGEKKRRPDGRTPGLQGFFVAWEADARRSYHRSSQVSRETDETPLSQLESQQIVQLAVAEYLSEDNDALAQIRRDYDQLMQKSEYAGMFKVITHRVDPSTTKFRDLAPAIASISSFEAFMENYRKKLKSGGVSALN